MTRDGQSRRWTVTPRGATSLVGVFSSNDASRAGFSTYRPGESIYTVAAKIEGVSHGFV
jgi:hypothetical protein